MDERKMTLKKIIEIYAVSDEDLFRLASQLLICHKPVSGLAISSEISMMLTALSQAKDSHFKLTNSFVPSTSLLSKYDLGTVRVTRERANQELKCYIRCLGSLLRELLEKELGSVELPVTEEEINVFGCRLKR